MSVKFNTETKIAALDGSIESIEEDPARGPVDHEFDACGQGFNCSCGNERHIEILNEIKEDLVQKGKAEDILVEIYKGVNHEQWIQDLIVKHFGGPKKLSIRLGL